jgi:chromosome segregation ATPase
MLLADSTDTLKDGQITSFSIPVAPAAPSSSRLKLDGSQNSRRIKSAANPESSQLLKDARDGKLDQLMRIQMNNYSQAVESTVSDITKRKEIQLLLEDELRCLESEIAKVAMEREILCANLTAREAKKKELMVQLATASKAVSQVHTHLTSG